jgi:hypothetical protein
MIEEEKERDFVCIKLLVVREEYIGERARERESERKRKRGERGERDR